MQIDSRAVALKHLAHYAQAYPTRAAVSTQIIALEAALKLPKGTEMFMSDIHGEYEAFTHILNNASGVVKEKVDKVLERTTSGKERAEFASLIYYPAQKLKLIKKKVKDLDEWYRLTLYRLIDVAKHVSSKNTRQRVRKSIPQGYEYIIDELLHASFEDNSREFYYERLVTAIVENGMADEIIGALAGLIKKMAVYKLHIVGDIFDRGPRPDIILDELIAHHSVDIQWGNHDVLWMGAAAGSEICIATALINCLSYNNLEVLEQGYGINLKPLADFALATYKNGDIFAPKVVGEDENEEDIQRVSLMHKAISIIMYKLQSAVLERNPDFGMEDRKVIERIDFKNGTYALDGKTYNLRDCEFPTVDPKKPWLLTLEEMELLEKLRSAFTRNEKLNRHVRFLYTNGSVYKIINNKLLFHGDVPLEANGTFTKVKFGGKHYAGKAYFEFCEATARQAYFAKSQTAQKQYGEDFMWYLWCGVHSPMFGRDRMTTFERRYIEDKAAHAEPKNGYYSYTNNEMIARVILSEFGLDASKSHIVNGHVPVEAGKGERPIKGGGKIIVIDGGFSKAYQSKTGLAGYTMVSSSRGLSLRAHQPFESIEKAVQSNSDIVSTVQVFEAVNKRILVEDTDDGGRLREEIRDLRMLLEAYSNGTIKEGAK